MIQSPFNWISTSLNAQLLYTEKFQAGFFDTEAAGKLESLTTNDIPVVLLGIPSADNLASAVFPWDGCLWVADFLWNFIWFRAI